MCFGSTSQLGKLVNIFLIVNPALHTLIHMILLVVWDFTDSLESYSFESPLFPRKKNGTSL